MMRRISLAKYHNISTWKASGLPKGVALVKGKYVGRVTILGSGIGGVRSQIRHLGTFNSIKNAAEAVRRAECAK
jgi:hypothetical protein